MLTTTLPLLLASSVAPSYPVAAILEEFKASCFEDGRKMKPGFMGSTLDAVTHWNELAKERGWVLVENADPNAAAGYLANRDYVALHKTHALNEILFAGMMGWGNSRMLGGELYKKDIGGRTVYLSIFGADHGDSENHGECRLYDPLGDGITRLPVTEDDVEAVVGHKVSKFKGPFGNPGYHWTDNAGFGNLQVHFGFDAWPISALGWTPGKRKFDPYVNYGMMLVTGFYDRVVIV